MGAEKESEKDATRRRAAFARSVLDELLGRKVGNPTVYCRFGVIIEMKAGEIVTVEVQDVGTYR